MAESNNPMWEESTISVTSPIFGEGRFGAIVTVHEDVECGEELLRSYGHEWIGLQYHPMKGNLPMMEVLEKNPEKILPKGHASSDFLDMNILQFEKAAVIYKPASAREEVRINQIIEGNSEGKDLVEVNTSSVRFFMMCLEYLAECFVVGGHPFLEYTWFNDPKKVLDEQWKT